jgi:biotin carboxyl carrier protein
VATLEGIEQEFEIEELTGHSLRLTLAGVQYEADVRRTGHSSFSILVGDRSFDLDVARQNEELIVASRGTETRLTLQDAFRRTRHASAREQAGGRVELKAMMPGRVVNLLVKVGDEVAAQQRIIVVEAMKMENELKTPRAGKVTDIRVSGGQTVEKGALLVVIE